MNHIKNMKSFVTGITAFVVSVLCFGAALIDKVETSRIIAGIILTSWSVISLFTAFSKKELPKNR